MLKPGAKIAYRLFRFAALLFIGALVVQSCWNTVMPVILTSLPKLTYVQALCLNVLCAELFKTSHIKINRGDEDLDD